MKYGNPFLIRDHVSPKLRSIEPTRKVAGEDDAVVAPLPPAPPGESQALLVVHEGKLVARRDLPPASDLIGEEMDTLEDKAQLLAKEAFIAGIGVRQFNYFLENYYPDIWQHTQNTRYVKEAAFEESPDPLTEEEVKEANAFGRAIRMAANSGLKGRASATDMF